MLGKIEDRRRRRQTEDEMVGRHHRFNAHEFEQAPGDGEWQGSLVCCSPWSCKESHTNEQLNNNSNTEIKITMRCQLMCVCVKSLQSCLTLFVTLWIVARQDPLSAGFSRQEYWNGLPCSPPGDLLDPGIEPTSPLAPTWQADSF